MVYNIKENWLYQNFDEFAISVSGWLNVNMFDKISWNYKKQINIDSNSDFFARFMLVNTTDFELNIYINWNLNIWNIKLFAFSKDNIEIKWEVNVIVWWEDNNINVEIISLLWKNWLIWINGNIDIKNWTKSNLWNLSQKSVYISDSWRTIFTPKLAINTNDVKASHGWKIERLDPNRLFYFGSKWISNEESKKLMIDWYINSFVWDLEQLDYVRHDLSSKIF